MSASPTAVSLAATIDVQPTAGVLAELHRCPAGPGAGLTDRECRFVYLLARATNAQAMLAVHPTAAAVVSLAAAAHDNFGGRVYWQPAPATAIDAGARLAAAGLARFVSQPETDTATPGDDAPHTGFLPRSIDLALYGDWRSAQAVAPGVRARLKPGAIVLVCEGDGAPAAARRASRDWLSGGLHSVRLPFGGGFEFAVAD